MKNRTKFLRMGSSRKPAPLVTVLDRVANPNHVRLVDLVKQIKAAKEHK